MKETDLLFGEMIDKIPTLAWSCLPDGTAEFLNQRWLDYTGRSAEEGLGWGWKASIHPEDLGKLMDTWLRLLATGEPGEEEALVLMLCDQPFVTAAVINDLVTAYRSSGKGIIASEYGGTMGVPALFRREYFAELAALSGAAGAKQIIAAHASEVVRVPFPQGTADIDTPEDYLGLQSAILSQIL